MLMVLSRYSRQTMLAGFGEEAQQKLLQSKVLVVGCGGLGIPALQYLVGMGVGTIGIADGDTISISNLNRQIIFTEDDAGKLKVEVAKERLHKQNPLVAIQAFPVHLTRENALSLISSFDIVINATDNIPSRYLINDACVMLNKPFVYGAIDKYEGQLSVFNFNNGPTYRCLYQNIAENIMDCNEAGVLGVVPGIIGCYQALEAVKVLTGAGNPLSGVLQVFDFFNNEQRFIKLKAKAKNKMIQALQQDYSINNCTQVGNIEPRQLYDMFRSGRDILVLDVREPEEFHQFHLQNSILSPLQQFQKNFPSLQPDVSVVAVCQKGIRSRYAVMMLQEKYPQHKIQNLVGGLDKWLQEIGDTFIVHE